jgi:DNA modification methylase
VVRSLGIQTGVLPPEQLVAAKCHFIAGWDPTVKPTQMLMDALLDVSDRGDVIVDPVLGSGSTLIAAEKTGRICRGVEIDPLYVDVIIRRFEAKMVIKATLIESNSAGQKDSD